MMEGFENCGNSKRMHVKPSTCNEMEEVLLTWFRQARTANIPINLTILKEKHHGVVYKAECGESKSVDEPTVTQWMQTLPNLIHGYKLRDIYNTDETGMFFNLMLDKTFTFCGENCHDENLMP
ncbi:tigger transposable element-derived protein 4-like [Schistocerca nitens]|uniref:tigger transposable element-derived protein 4-like n=1 Tax=Schistocerca nitens TaxID=7011 RepID=UPI002118D43A|nr:tigger transposable element-derived protein 4-like [Schistocerca nitens]